MVQALHYVVADVLRTVEVEWCGGYVEEAHRAAYFFQRHCCILPFGYHISVGNEGDTSPIENLKARKRVATVAELRFECATTTGGKVDISFGAVGARHNKCGFFRFYDVDWLTWILRGKMLTEEAGAVAERFDVQD